VEGFGAALEAVGGLSIPRVAELCGLTEAHVAQFYRLFTETPRTVTLFSQGINQSSSGVDKANSILNVHLATGRVGLPGATPFSITGQPNAMGGREVGGLSNQLAAHMDFTPDDVGRVGRFWNAPNLARAPGLKAVELFEAVGAGRIKALWIMATNPAVSLPEADRAVAALRDCPFVVVSEVVARTDTSVHAHVRLPAAAWGEKDGTVTNSERRISRQRAFLPPPGEARPDWWIVAEVARRMGHGRGFDYAGPAAIFAEHAALSAFENDGRRDLDLGALSGLDAAGYENLAPVQWPVPAVRPSGSPRLFAEGRYFTPGGAARMVTVNPRPPVRIADAGHPFILNTGRIRDQWHTMTRTGKAARLLAHVAEPYVEICPRDARRVGVRHGNLARLHNRNGEMLARVVESAALQSGSVFAPIHWNDRFTARGRVDVLTHAVTDPISGQPEFKHTPVAVTAYPASWHGFVMSRLALEAGGASEVFQGYWTRVRGKSFWRHELAGRGAIDDWSMRMRELLDPVGEWVEMKDSAAARYRGALLAGGRLLAVYFFEREAAGLPPRQWLESLFDRGRLSDAERTALLTGRPSHAVPDAGRIVCACFGVGENTLREAVRKGARSVEDLGIRLKAGTNCGSCIPELKSLLSANT
jgi:assimilatory nitrate reductase catalytic subunit